MWLTTRFGFHFCLTRGSSSAWLKRQRQVQSALAIEDHSSSGSRCFSLSLLHSHVAWISDDFDLVPILILNACSFSGSSSLHAPTCFDCELNFVVGLGRIGTQLRSDTWSASRHRADPHPSIVAARPSRSSSDSSLSHILRCPRGRIHPPRTTNPASSGRPL